MNKDEHIDNLYGGIQSDAQALGEAAKRRIEQKAAQWFMQGFEELQKPAKPYKPPTRLQEFFREVRWRISAALDILAKGYYPYDY